MSKLFMTFASGSVADRLRKEPGVIVASGNETILLAEGDKSPFQSGKTFQIEEAAGQFAATGNIIYANIPVDSNARSLLFHRLLKEKSRLGSGHNGFAAYRLGVDPDDNHGIVIIQFTEEGNRFRDSTDYLLFQERLKEAVEQKGAGPIIKHYVVSEPDNL
ncbi:MULTISPECIES: hypothetical protein [unclassified Exiguobacterium]|uniref:hypothetical protein n=1 Tax=unclassified Exiguobacterium TaxID=2644629 RepID=UPI001F423625|nr:MULTISPECIES: hypothetical protein [unclassified Exiguobacterium]